MQQSNGNSLIDIIAWLVKWCNECLMIYVGLQTSGSSMRVVWWSVAGGTVPCGEPTPDAIPACGSGLDPLLLYYKLVNNTLEKERNYIIFLYRESHISPAIVDYLSTRDEVERIEINYTFLSFSSNYIFSSVNELSTISTRIVCCIQSCWEGIIFNFLLNKVPLS